MNLPHNAHLISIPLPQAVTQALSSSNSEVDLAASKHFYDFESNWDGITAAYEAYFEQVVRSMTSILGQPIYRGQWDAVDRCEWEAVLPENADAQDLVVWQQQDSKRVYCRYSWEDKETPILVAIGVEGCSATGIAYDGQFD